jgi:hypothetical protein
MDVQFIKGSKKEWLNGVSRAAAFQDGVLRRKKIDFS